MKVSEMFPSKYLAKGDAREPIYAVIQSIGKETMKQDNTEKHILHFNGNIKPMVLNKGNASTLEALFGDDSNGWVGKSIEIYCDPTIMFGGKIVGGLRLRAPQQQQTMTYADAQKACDAVGITKDELVAALKAAGESGWNSTRCTPIVRGLIDAKQNVPFDDSPQDDGSDIPY